MTTLINILAIISSSFMFVACVMDLNHQKLSSRAHITDSKVVEELDLQSRVMSMNAIGSAVRTQKEMQKIQGRVIKMVAAPKHGKTNPYIYVLCRKTEVFTNDRGSSNYFWVKLATKDVLNHEIDIQTEIIVEQSLDADPFVEHRNYFLFYSPSRIVAAAH